MEARQSDIRNKVIAPVFKKLGLIDQWGNGLKLISDELKTYPEIEFKWFEKGMQFQVHFIKKYFYKAGLDVETQLTQQGLNLAKIGNNLDETELEILKLIAENENLTIVDLGEKIGVSVSTINRHLKKLIDSNIIRREGSKKSGTWVILDVK